MDGFQNAYELSQKFNLEVDTIVKLQDLYNNTDDKELEEKIKKILNQRLDLLVGTGIK